MHSSTVRVLLIDPLASFSEALSYRLKAESFIETVHAASSIREAVRVSESHHPDIALSEVKLSDGEVLSLSTHLKKANPNVKVGLFSRNFSDIFLEKSLNESYQGYLLKTESIDMLTRSILNMSQGSFVLSDGVRNRLDFNQSTLSYKLKPSSKLLLLSKHQLEVVAHLARGLAVKEVAKVMKLTPKSVDSHKYRIMLKLGIHDRVELARLAIREGLIDP